MSYRVENGKINIVNKTATSAIQAACESLHLKTFESLEEYTIITEIGTDSKVSIATAYLASGGQPFRDILKKVTK